MHDLLTSEGMNSQDKEYIALQMDYRRTLKGVKPGKRYMAQQRCEMLSLLSQD